MTANATAQNPRRGRPNLRGLGRALGVLSNHKGVALIAVVSLLLSISAQLFVPQMVQRSLDAVTQGLVLQEQAAQGTTQAAAGNTGQLIASIQRSFVWSLVLILVFAVVRGLFAFTQAFMGEKLSQNVAYDFRNLLFEKIQRLSFTYHDQNRTGQLMIRATDDVEKLRVFLGQGLLIALQAVVLLTGALILMLLTNLQLTLVLLPILPIAFIMFIIFGSVSQPLFTEVQQRISRLNTILQESVAGIKVIKAFTRERQQAIKFRGAADSLMQQQITVARVFSFLFPVIFFIANLGQALVLYFGGRQIIGGTLTIGEWQKFSLYLIFVFFPIGQLGFIISQMSQASASATRIYEILDAENDVVDKPDAIPLPPVTGNVRFENVTFRYFGSSDAVLSDISFSAEPGQTVALLGATGSGKTTIINLIPRFYDVSEGRVLIDGYDVRDVQLETLRRQIGIVLQETNLFGGTIRDNISFGRPDATDDEIIAAAQAAAAHEFIMSFPEAYDTPVSERGATLSGGQKQRIAIARALLMNPRVLILDDSTSSVDVTTEALIQDALDKLMEGRTSFVIAQRISTVLNADQILVLDNGRLVASGRHAELMDTSADYADIYRSQLVEDAVETHTGDSSGSGVGVL